MLDLTQPIQATVVSSLDRKPVTEKAYHVFVKYPMDEETVTDTAFWMGGKWVTNSPSVTVQPVVIAWVEYANH